MTRDELVKWVANQLDDYANKCDDRWEGPVPNAKRRAQKIVAKIERECAEYSGDSSR